MKDKKNKTTRLFLFAGYNAKGAIDAALVYYINSLAQFGDIILVMDSDCPKSELKKVSDKTLYASAARHGEYDFGSYKRAYLWAQKNLDLSKYDFVYMVNDSVYGPLYNMAPYFTKMESFPDAAFGIVKNPHREHPHIQSWFVGLRPCVFLSQWYDEFINSVTKQTNKGRITKLYEQGLSKRIIENGMTWSCIYTVRNRGIYNHVKKLYRIKMPFMKKVAFNRYHGALGRQIKYVLNQIPNDARSAIIESAGEQYGHAHVGWLLTSNPIKILIRRVHHALYKILKEGI